MDPAPTADGTTINLRASSAQRAVIDQAARVSGKNRTEFMLEASYEKAQQVLLDRTMFALDAAGFERFAALLDVPLHNSEAVHRLLTRRAPWETEAR
jgi:uncharacterized protein (DUF1778 family)